MKYFILVSLLIFQSESFKQNQLQHSRVKNAYDNKEATVKNYFKLKHLNEKGFNLFIQIFKKEQLVEVWIKEKGKTTFDLLHTYSICSSSGTLGPKRKEGDMQVPEGVYHIEHFNPVSNFHLSLGVNYPNASDKILSDKKHPGGNIYIHGNCVTIGCVPITDDFIEELYVLAVEARNNGQNNIPVYIFPNKMENGTVEKLAEEYDTDQTTISFWKNLQSIYLDFKTSHTLKKVHVDAKGKYYF
jgi:murein L,D-transpeptidase YafK